MTPEDLVRSKFDLVRATLDERQTRLWAGAEAHAIGYGGVAAVSRATGLAISTVRAGRDEALAGASPSDVVRVRRKGAGRPKLEAKMPGLIDALEKLVDPATRGDPESPLRWTCKSTRQLAAALTKEGFGVSPQKVGEMLHDLGYSLRVVKKVLEGKQHPDRNAQFEFINSKTRAFQFEGLPVISVDTKKKELVGDFKNGGSEWQPQGHQEKALVHDFPDRGVGKAVPYGIYDVTQNNAWVVVGSDHDTPTFAVSSIDTWWIQMGAPLSTRGTHHCRFRW